METRHNVTKELYDSDLQKDIEKYDSEKTLIVVSDMNQPKTDETFQTNSSCDNDSVRTTFEGVKDGFLDTIDDFDTDNEDKPSRNVSDLNYEDNLHKITDVHMERLKDPKKEKREYKLENDDFIEKGDKRKTEKSELDKIIVEGYFKHVKFKDIKELIVKNTGAAPGPGNMIQ